MTYDKFIKEYIEKFSLQQGTNLDDTITMINNGWCYCLAISFKTKFPEAEIVRSYCHWFIRIPKNPIMYYDAFIFNGTTNLVDITDNLDSTLEVWEIDDFYKLYDVSASKKEFIFKERKIDASLKMMGLK